MISTIVATGVLFIEIPKSFFPQEDTGLIQGIAEGAAAAGAKTGDRPIDLTDIAGVNLWIELACLDDALRASIKNAA